jgi:dihydroorotate dehydrogenase electron transfer subunit
LFDNQTEIAFNININPSTYLMGLSAPDVAFSAKPGQFVMIRINEGTDPLLRRPFSICGVRDQDLLLILYKTVGRGTQILSKKKPGEKLRVMGPLGNGFDLPAPDKKAILIAGGIGIAPLFFLAHYLKDGLHSFLTGFGTLKDIILPGHISSEDLNTSIATDDGSSGYSGFVTDLLETSLRSHAREKERIVIYSCGPMPMLKKTALIAASHGVECRVSLEALMACGLGACQGCAVKIVKQDQSSPYRHVCKDGPVFGSNEIDWSAV